MHQRARTDHVMKWTDKETSKHFSSVQFIRLFTFNNRGGDHGGFYFCKFLQQKTSKKGHGFF